MMEKVILPYAYFKSRKKTFPIMREEWENNLESGRTSFSVMRVKEDIGDHLHPHDCEGHSPPVIPAVIPNLIPTVIHIYSPTVIPTVILTPVIPRTLFPHSFLHPHD